MPLDKYNSKRDFKKTKEPKGRKKPSEGELQFVVQKHAASRLHYDFRLEINGVLVSWAVPKGPSANPSDKRLAIQTEDHPMDYIDFEGIIPQGEYGGGTVIVWDRGTYHAEGNNDVSKDNRLMKKQLKEGAIKVILKGEKLHGAWHMVLMKGEEEARQWLLMKSKDEFADTKYVFNELSVLSGKSLEQIESSNKSTSKAEEEDPKESKKKIKGDEKHLNVSDINSQKKEFLAEDLAAAKKISSFPSDWRPMLATLADEAFDNEDWIFESKYDGYRALAEINSNSAKLISRNGLNFTKYPSLIPELEKLRGNIILDGEVVVEDASGKSRFQWLQHFEENPVRGQLKYYVFDILYFNGFDLRPLNLILRKKILKALLPKSMKIIYSEHVHEAGLKAIENAAKLGLEGIIAKKASSKYYSGKRSKDWLKIKIVQQQEMVIGGYTEPNGSRSGFGAILCGYYEGNTLRYSGKVGTGFTDSILKELKQKLEKIERKTSPFSDPPNEKLVHWVTPVLVAQIKYSELTETNSLRHPVYLGLRTDKKATEVKLETPQIETDELDENSAEDQDSKTNKTDQNMEKTPPKLNAGKAKLLSTKVAFTNLDKIFWPKEKITKGQVISYYNEVADYILPHMKDRPQSLRRTPDGLKSDGFFQKNVAGMVPSWIKTRKIKSESKEESIEYMLCQDKDTLLFMANWGCIEMNPWSSRVGSINNPDFIIFDIDPKDAPLKNTVKTALKVKEVLDELKVHAFLKTSGGNGLHIFIPVLPKYTYDQTRNFSHLISQMVHRQLPEITSLERMPAKRKGKVYLDYLQNGKGKTMASIYSLRPRPNPGVSTPLEWDELTESFDMKDYNYFTILPRLSEKGDLWKNIMKNPADLKKVLDGLK